MLRINKNELEKEIRGLSDRKGFGGASYPWQDTAVRAWKRLGLTGSPSPSFFKCFREHEALSETVAGTAAEMGAKDPEAYFYKLLSIRMKGGKHE